MIDIDGYQQAYRQQVFVHPSLALVGWNSVDFLWRRFSSSYFPGSPSVLLLVALCVILYLL